ncbi:MAG: hypothetical protein ACXVVQ_22245 [Solirubrobacteraceae bacterium]
MAEGAPAETLRVESTATWRDDLTPELLELAVDVVLAGAARGQILERVGGLELFDRSWSS